MKIAVVGSGVSGLVTAHLLSRSHQVTVFEADDRIGGHVNTVPVSEGLSIDTGFIVFNPANYPLFCRLLNRLEVDSQPSVMSFSVKDERSGIEFAGTSLATLFSGRGSLGRPDHWRMLMDVRKFIRLGPRLAVCDASLTVRQFVRESRLSDEFTERFLGPLGCALWSCPHEALLDFPIRFVAEFLENHGMLRMRRSGKPVWRTVSGGSDTYVKALVRQTQAEFRTESRVERLSRSAQSVRLCIGSHEFEFDEVVFSGHADQALETLVEPSPLEQELLSAFPYQANVAILHTDTRVLPKNPKAWSSWNYRVPKEILGVATVSYNMNILQTLDTEETYIVSLNEGLNLDAKKVVARFEYCHPVSTAKGLAARARRSDLVRHDRVSYCGAYWGYGFHEDGVRSAVEVCRAFGEDFSDG